MKRLTLLRHGKSSWDTGEADFDRPLNARGLNDAPLMGSICAQKLPPPDRIILSPARRTRQTIEALVAAWPLSNADTVEVEELYLAGMDDWLSAFNRYGEGIGHLLGCGHQPGLENLARWLCPDFTFRVPTAAVISLTFTSEIAVGKGSLDFYGIPAQFRE